jgi:hypothetical protein
MREWLKKMGAFQLGVLLGIVYGSIVATLTSYSYLVMQ